MKSRNEFANDAFYNDYLLAYYAGQFLAARATGPYVVNAEAAVLQAQALINALKAYQPGTKTADTKTFNY